MADTTLLLPNFCGFTSRVGGIRGTAGNRLGRGIISLTRTGPVLFLYCVPGIWRCIALRSRCILFPVKIRWLTLLPTWAHQLLNAFHKMIKGF